MQVKIPFQSHKLEVMSKMTRLLGLVFLVFRAETTGLRPKLV